MYSVLMEREKYFMKAHNKNDMAKKWNKNFADIPILDGQSRATNYFTKC